MTARPFRVEMKSRGGSDRWGWVNSVGSMEAARREVEFRRRGRLLNWEFRVVNRDTAEVTHL